MGARQSKRSVDITTATGGAPESGGEVVAGKLGKLEDGVVTPETVAPKQNGDAVLKDKERQLDSETPENEKDSSTEKGLIVPPAASDSATTPAAVENGLGDASPDVEMPNAASPASTKEDSEKTLDEEPQSPMSAEESQEITSPTSEEKQTEKKKEKKKKWSFRSISFSKKDKQKPSKKQQQEGNGDIEKVPEEATDETVAAASGGDIPAEKAANEEKPLANAEEKPKVEEAPACKKPDSPIAENVSGKPVVETPVQQVCEKPEAPKAEIVCEKSAAPEKIVDKPAVVEPVAVPTEQVKVEIPTALDAVSDPVKTEMVKVEETPKPEPIIESPVAEEPEKKKEEETLSPASAADEKQKEVCDNTSPPPLPESLPPSQVSVFAETMMALPETVTSLHETSAPTLTQSEPSPLPEQTPVQTLVSLLKVEDVPASKDSSNVTITTHVEITAEIMPPPVELPPAAVLPTEEVPLAPIAEPVAQLEKTVESSVEKPMEQSTVIPTSDKLSEPVIATQADVQASDSAAAPVTELKAPEPVMPLTPVNVCPVIEPKLSETTNTAPEVQKEVVDATTDAKVPEIIPVEVPASEGSVEGPISPVLSETTTESQQQKDLPSPPPSPASVQEVEVVNSVVPQNESLPPAEEQLPSPPPSPISALDTSISESGAVNTNTEEQLPSPPPSPASIQETSTDSPLPPPATEDLPQPSDEQKTGSFDESAPLPPPPSVLDSVTSVEYNGALICPPSPPAPENLPVQQVASNENIAEVSATESTQSEETMQVSPKALTSEIDEKVPGMVMLDGVPPVEIPITENSVAVAEN